MTKKEEMLIKKLKEKKWNKYKSKWYEILEMWFPNTLIDLEYEYEFDAYFDKK